MTPRSPRVLTAGLATIDVMQTVERMPRSNEKMVALLQSVSYGGPAANAAGVAHGLGAEASLAAAFGTSATADIALRLISGDGILVWDATPCDDTPLAISSVLIEKAGGQRSVVSTNAQRRGSARDFPRSALVGVDAVLLDGHGIDLCLGVAREARAAGIPVTFDGGSWKEGTDDLLRLVDVAVVSEAFRPPDGSDPLELALSRGSAWAARTCGDQPTEVATRGRRWTISPTQVDAVDTLGAGDALHGALVVAVATLGATAAEAHRVMEFATAIATLSCAATGARGWIEQDSLHRQALHFLSQAQC